MNFEENQVNNTNPVVKEPTTITEQNQQSSEQSTATEPSQGYALVQTTRLKREIWLKIPNNFEPLQLKDTVIYETERDGITLQHFGTIVRLMPQPTYDPTGRIKRKATAEDQKRIFECLNNNSELEKIFKNSIREENLEMTLQAIEQGFDGKKITFYYKAEDKVDFRKLVKMLAASCRCRIELYQLSTKEQFMLHSCIGICGLETCCSRQHGLFERKISPALAKKQKLSYNAAKMSGCCGKPRCCLMYEAEQYTEFTAELPKINSYVEYNNDEFKVIDWDYCYETLTLEYTDPEKENAQIVISTTELNKLKTVTTPRVYTTTPDKSNLDNESDIFELENNGVHDVYFATKKDNKKNEQLRTENSK